MKRPSCGSDNREGAKFCGECAAPLAAALACPSCGTANPKVRKFCDSCGGPLAELSAPDPRSYTPKHLAEKILTTRSSLEGERKQVTVLFADVKGSMDLSESIDPEDWHRIMERFFTILTDGVHRFEGTVNQYMGDGIMALFGAPIAHEDHAARACYAALALQEDLRRYANELRVERGISFSVRMGLNSGEVVVGKIGDDLRMDYTALGHTASLGARMEQIAEPGKRDLVGSDASVKALPEFIRGRTGGNPFFIEEVVQALVEDGSLVGVRGAYRLVKPMEKVAVPPTVQAVLAARIDRLESREKHLLQTAAVIGKEFAEPVLKRVAELPEAELQESVGKLAAAEFIYEVALYPQAEYAFKHPLTQEVAYRSQLGERRSRTHAAVARAIAELYPEQLDERAALLAHHWERAGEAARAAEWYRRAALWTGQTNVAEAARHWQKVRALAAELRESAETVPLALEASRELLNAAWRTGVPEAEADALFADARALAERRGDLRSVALVTSFYGTIKASHGDVRSSLAYGLESVRLAEQTGDPVLIGALHDGVIWAHGLLGRLAAVEEGYTRAVALLGDDPMAGIDFYGISPLLTATTTWLHALVWMGRFDDAELELVRAREVAKQHQQLDMLSYMETVTVLLARLGGNVVRPLDHAARSASELAEKAHAFARVVASWTLGTAYGLAQEWPASIAALESGVTLARDRRVLYMEPWLLTALAESYLGAGDARLARTRVEEALALAQQRQTRTQEIDAQLGAARVYRGTEGLVARPRIEAALERALALVRETGARGYEPQLYLERAALARLTGDEATRQRELREAHRLFLEIGAPIRAAEIAQKLAPL